MNPQNNDVPFRQNLVVTIPGARVRAVADGAIDDECDEYNEQYVYEWYPERTKKMLSEHLLGRIFETLEFSNARD
jgi:hypothetical protein